MRNLIFSASSLNTVQLCGQLHQFEKVLRIRRKPKFDAVDKVTESKGMPLDKGSIIHTGLRVYYKLKKRGEVDHDTMIRLSQLRMREEAIETRLPIHICDFLEIRFAEYVNFYRNRGDRWKIIDVERYFAKVLYESEEDDLRVVLEGVIDLVVDTGEFKATVDHKTASRPTIPNKMGNQFKAYCWAMETRYLYKNEINLQKTKTGQDAFRRYPLHYHDDILAAWVMNAVYWAKVLANYLEEDFWPQNETSCDKFGGCAYKQICETQPLARSFIIGRDYVASADNWSPKKHVERSKKEDEWIEEVLRAA
jgi:hypothetical protein